MSAAQLAGRLTELWAVLDALGATVHRRPVTHLHRSTLRGLVAAETERVRVLTSPEAADYVTWRSTAARWHYGRAAA